MSNSSQTFMFLPECAWWWWWWQCWWRQFWLVLWLCVCFPPMVCVSLVGRAFHHVWPWSPATSAPSHNTHTHTPPSPSAPADQCTCHNTHSQVTHVCLSIHLSIYLCMTNSLCVVLLSNSSEFPGIYGVSASGSLRCWGPCGRWWIHAPPSQHTHAVLPQHGRHGHTLGQDAQEEPVVQLEGPDTTQRRPALLVRKLAV